MIKNNIDDLLIEAQKGDERSLERLLILYKPLIIKNASQIYINGYEIEDLIQIGNIALMKAIRKYQANRGVNFTIFAAKVIKNDFNEELRKIISKKWDEKFKCSLDKEGMGFSELLVSDETVEEAILLKEERAILKEAINSLPEDERDIIIWFYVKDKPLTEYALKKNLNLNTASKRKSRALEKLKKYFLRNNR